MADLAGELRHRVDIGRYEDVPDGAGGFTRAFRSLGKRWAKIENINGREAVIGAALTGVSTFRVTLRFIRDLDSADRLIHPDGRELNIRSAEDIDGLRIRTVILCDSGSPQGGA